MNYLGVVFSDAFGLFWGFWFDFWIKGQKKKSGQFRSLTLWLRDPM